MLCQLTAARWADRWLCFLCNVVTPVSVSPINIPKSTGNKPPNIAPPIVAKIAPSAALHPPTRDFYRKNNNITFHCLGSLAEYIIFFVLFIEL